MDQARAIALTISNPPSASWSSLGRDRSRAVSSDSAESFLKIRADSVLALAE
jgi:hypothetical protein